MIRLFGFQRLFESSQAIWSRIGIYPFVVCERPSSSFALDGQDDEVNTTGGKPWFAAARQGGHNERPFHLLNASRGLVLMVMGYMWIIDWGISSDWLQP